MRAAEQASGHREIEHTADLGFEVWAADEPALLAEATLALCELVYEQPPVRPHERRELAVRGSCVEDRIVRWLHEVYLQAEAGWLTAGAEAIVCDAESATGALLGEPYTASRHVLHTEIKAVTYHELRVRRDADGLLRTVVILDV